MNGTSLPLLLHGIRNISQIEKLGGDTSLEKIALQREIRGGHR